MKQEDDKVSRWVLLPLGLFIGGFLTLAYARTMYPDAWLGKLVAGGRIWVAAAVLLIVAWWIAGILDAKAGDRRRSSRTDFDRPE